MTRQPRQPAGTRRAGVSTGGRYTTKPVPDLADTELGFNNDDVAGVGPMCDWDQRKVKLWGLSTTFNRTVDDDGTATVTTSCDDPTMMLLARKGNASYWSGNGWNKDRNTRRAWAAGITADMLTEGLVPAGYDDGFSAAMSAASSPNSRQPTSQAPRCALTAIVAQIRGLALLQSMAPAHGWETTFGGHEIPATTNLLMWNCFRDAEAVFQRLQTPPWNGDTSPWGPQPTAGHATTIDSEDMFVGENGDLLWRAVTETDHHGWSPLKETLSESYRVAGWWLPVTAALHDETAAYQLTHGLFDGAADVQQRRELKTNALVALNNVLNPPDDDRWTHSQKARTRMFRERKWTVAELDRIRSFIGTVEALQP